MDNKASFEPTSKVNFPLISVEAPLVVPFITTVAPGRVSFVTWSDTVPEMLRACANAEVSSTNNAKSKNKLFAQLIICFGSNDFFIYI